MSRKGKKYKNTDLPAPWNQIHTAIWLIGIAILAWRGWWWPGILVLVALSVLLEGFVRARYPQQPEEDVAVSTPSVNPVTSAEPPMPPAPPTTETEKPTSRYPARCPSCGAPVKVPTAQPAGECTYCGAHIAPLN
ncbi:MAG: hypothetical protein OHK0052_08390 [Anaerolineales bacterium]